MCTRIITKKSIKGGFMKNLNKKLFEEQLRLETKGIEQGIARAAEEVQKAKLAVDVQTPKWVVWLYTALYPPFSKSYKALLKAA